MSVTDATGFVAAGGPCGVKSDGRADLALVCTDDGRPVPAAAVFTQNKAAAAPVQVSRAHLRATAGHAAAVILNSGNANAATGDDGRAHAEAMASAAATAIGCRPEEVLVCSTGLIGIPLPIDRILTGIPDVAATRSSGGGQAAAEAILTTDTADKQASVAAGGVIVGGMAKGAAMLAPNMATMLAVITTDAVADPADLQAILAAAVDASFNVMSVDGCTSTNDTVILMASGKAGPGDHDSLSAAVAEVCWSLASQMVGDAEGATKVVTVEVAGAASDDEAAAGARKVAESQLVKCSWYGQDPYWGRVVSELGSAGIAFDMEKVTVAYGGNVVCRGGVEVDHDRDAVAKHMDGRHLKVTCDLGIGQGEARILTNDLTHAYIDENMGTS